MWSKDTESLSHAELVIEGWISMYVSGRWTLGEFEAHLEAMLPVFRPDEWLPPPKPQAAKRRPKPRTAKQAAEAWSASAARSAANYSAGASSFQQAIASGRWSMTKAP